MNEQDERTYGVRLEEAFPKTMNEISYGHGNVNAINKLTVSFSYRKFRNLGTEEVNGGEQKSLEAKLSEQLGNTLRANLQSRLPAVLRRLF